MRCGFRLNVFGPLPPSSFLPPHSPLSVFVHFVYEMHCQLGDATLALASNSETTSLPWNQDTSLIRTCL